MGRTKERMVARVTANRTSLWNADEDRIRTAAARGDLFQGSSFRPAGAESEDRVTVLTAETDLHEGTLSITISPHDDERSEVTITLEAHIPFMARGDAQREIEHWLARFDSRTKALLSRPDAEESREAP